MSVQEVPDSICLHPRRTAYVQTKDRDQIRFLVVILPCGWHAAALSLCHVTEIRNQRSPKLEYQTDISQRGNQIGRYVSYVYIYSRVGVTKVASSRHLISMHVCMCPSGTKTGRQILSKSQCSRTYPAHTSTLHYTSDWWNVRVTSTNTMHACSVPGGGAGLKKHPNRPSSTSMPHCSTIRRGRAPRTTPRATVGRCTQVDNGKPMVVSLSNSRILKFIFTKTFLLL
jgi:hypothetical protein